MWAPPLASQDILGCCGPGEVVSGIFRASLNYVLKDPGSAGMLATPDFGVPLEDEVLREASVVRDWALHLVHPRWQQVPHVSPVF